MPKPEIHHPDKRVSTGAYSAGVLPARATVQSVLGGGSKVEINAFAWIREK